jgi:uncharacterized protein YndB with AHSA1/START domain
MAEATKSKSDVEQPAPLRISRVFPASRALLFKAWSTADHVKRWFCPETYTIPEATVDLRVGGAFEICMRAPNGQQHWTRGTLVEVTPPDRLAISMRVFDDHGAELFKVFTEATFTDVAEGSRLDVIQSYEFIDPAMAAPMVAGAPEGWRTTLDKLAAEIERIQANAEKTRSVAHGVFSLERTYDAPAARVWAALTEEAAKSRWFSGPPGGWELIERFMDVRPGGRERLKGRWGGGTVSTFDALYYDVIPNQRLVYSYEMHIGEDKISVSLATLQLTAQDGRTTLSVTEQGAFLDGYDDANTRHQR